MPALFWTPRKWEKTSVNFTVCRGDIEFAWPLTRPVRPDNAVNSQLQRVTGGGDKALVLAAVGHALERFASSHDVLLVR